MLFAFLIIFAYLLGAVPFGFMIAKAHGQDLRKIGSGNIGATNTGRILGKKWGIIFSWPPRNQGNQLSILLILEAWEKLPLIP